MHIAIDISALSGAHHSVRGVGFYIEHLKTALVKKRDKHTYTFFTAFNEITTSTDVIHIPYFQPFSLTLPVFKKCKTVITIHDMTPLLFPKHFPAGVLGKAIWYVQKLLMQSVDGIITDSQASKKDIVHLVGIPEEKVSVVYLAADTIFQKKSLQLKEKELLKKKYNLPNKFLLYVGDVTWNKNIPRIIEAAKTTTIPLVLVGKAIVEKNFDANNPWNRDQVQIQKMLQNNSLTTCLGFVPTDDLVQLYNCATALVMPSLYEGFGLPILEAMQCGLPVITSQEGSLQEISGDAAFFVNAYDTKDIAKGMSAVFFDHNLQKKLSQKGILRAKQFSWEKTAKETVRIYEKM